MNSLGIGVIAGAVMICIVLFIGMCLFIASYSVVEPTYMAISRNKISSRIEEDKVYFEGRHFLGVGNEFIYYPMAWQLVEFTDDDAIGTVDYVCKVEEPLDAATSEGTTTEVELSLYFTIPPQQLINFYTTYGINYQDSLANECKRVLKETMTKFSYQQLFKARSNISSVMREDLGRNLARRRCQLQKLLLRAIYFGDSLENTIEKSVIAAQGQNENGYINEINKVNAEIETMRKKNAFEISVIMAEAQMEATKLIEDARAFAASKNANSTASAWKAYQEVTELSTEDLLRVQWARTIGGAASTDSLALGYDKVASKFVQLTKNA